MKWLIVFTILLFVALGVIVINLPPRGMTMKDLHPIPVPASKQVMIGTMDTTSAKTSETPGGTIPTDTSLSNPHEQPGVLNPDKVRTEYYIIIESVRNHAMAKGKAEMLKRQYNADIIVLPPTENGNFRLSYGKYSSYEEASVVIKKIRKKIREDAWIYSIPASVGTSK
jgi:hypothetical protein